MKLQAVRIWHDEKPEPIAEVYTFGISEALMDYFCDIFTPHWVWSTCIELGKAYNEGDTCEPLQRALNIWIEEI